MRFDIRPPTKGVMGGLRATGTFKAIILMWNLPLDMEDYLATEVWWSKTNILSSAARYDIVNGNSVTIPLEDSDERYFWIRMVNQYGRTDGPFSPVVSAGARMLEQGDFDNVIFDLSTAQVVGELSKDRITGLGALAALNKAGITDIVGLGALAQLDAVAAQNIGAGTLAAGVVYAGTVNANQVNATNLASITATIGTLRTQTSGGRVEIADNIIKVFDTSNALRVKIGNLN